MTTSDLIAVGSLTVAALSVILTGVALVLNHRSTATEREHADRVRREQWAHEEEARRRQRADESAREVLRAFARLRVGNVLRQSDIQPFHTEVFRYAQDLGAPTRQRVIDLIELAYYWSAEKASRTGLMAYEINSGVGHHGHDVVGCYLRADPLPEWPEWLAKAKRASDQVDALDKALMAEHEAGVDAYWAEREEDDESSTPG